MALCLQLQGQGLQHSCGYLLSGSTWPSTVKARQDGCCPSSRRLRLCNLVLQVDSRQNRNWSGACLRFKNPFGFKKVKLWLRWNRPGRFLEAGPGLEPHSMAPHMSTLFSQGHVVARGLWHRLCATPPFSAQLSRMPAPPIKGSEALERSSGPTPPPPPRQSLPQAAGAQVTCDRNLSWCLSKSKTRKLTSLSLQL